MKKVELNLSTTIKDIRPFQWHNYAKESRFTK